MTTQNTELIEDAIDHFRAVYVQTLKSRLAEYAEDGRVDEKVSADNVIDGDLLTGCDEAAYSAVRSEYGWRLGTDVLDEQFNVDHAGDTLYDGIDWDGIITDARAANR